ncbi:unnamed protein product [Gongylonema pulchrum]|uniref:Prenylcys_lyase domain-containing protein n=1 Tax=Gongylonema pulchrum TaxID=637853 RepID=A0A183ER73_9BILA|nr:unnamed protein product [Gongylonema pulchrum]
MDDPSWESAAFRFIPDVNLDSSLKGSLRAAHWSMSDDDALNSVFVSNTDLPYNAIGHLSPVDYKKGENFPKTGPNRVWKVFSKEALKKPQLMEFFSELRNVTKANYKHPPSGRPKFRLSKNICYVNAVEWLASSIETSALGGRNCVNMLLEDLGLQMIKKPIKNEL